MTGSGTYQMFLTIAESAVTALAADRILLATDLRDEGMSEPSEMELAFYLSSYLSSQATGKPGASESTAVVSAYTDAEDWFSFHEDLSAFEALDQSMLERIWPRLHSAMPELGAAAELIETATPQTYYETTRRRFGMIGRPTPAAEGIIPTPFPNVQMVGDTVAEAFGLDGIVGSAWKTAQQIIK
jgi:phytoene dehydrogenase-like protein